MKLSFIASLIQQISSTPILAAEAVTSHCFHSYITDLHTTQNMHSVFIYIFIRVMAFRDVHSTSHFTGFTINRNHDSDTDIK